MASLIIGEQVNKKGKKSKIEEINFVIYTFKRFKCGCWSFMAPGWTNVTSLWLSDTRTHVLWFLAPLKVKKEPGIQVQNCRTSSKRSTASSLGSWPACSSGWVTRASWRAGCGWAPEQQRRCIITTECILSFNSVWTELTEKFGRTGIPTQRRRGAKEPDLSSPSTASSFIRKNPLTLPSSTH